LDFVISRDEGIVSIDNQPLAIDTSPVPVNVDLVVYDCSGGAGNIEYNDRLRLLEPFIDLTPYTPFVNSWLTQASALVFPITLTQAKNVKIGLVDGIFNSKRQLPITTQGQTWDATDQSMMGMQAAVTAWDIAQDVTSADAQFANKVNGPLLTCIRTADIVTSACTGTGASFPYYNSGLGGVNSPTFLNAASGGGVTQQPMVQTSKSQIAPATPLTGPPIDWPPLNSTVMVRLSVAQMRSLISSIQQRRNSLQSTRLTKTNAINAKLNVADIIAYDVTTGWPF
jgi:hypothetical protein